jgi:hypothetical protein
MSPIAAPVFVPGPIGYEANQPVDTQRVLKVLSAKVVLPFTETEPEERTEAFPVDVDCASVLSAGDALENQEAVFVFYQALRARFTALQECPKHLPAICTWIKVEIENGHDVIHMQAAQQLTLRITATI